MILLIRVYTADNIPVCTYLGMLCTTLDYASSLREDVVSMGQALVSELGKDLRRVELVPLDTLPISPELRRILYECN